MKTIIYTHKDFKLPNLNLGEKIILGLGNCTLSSRYTNSEIIYESVFQNRLEPQKAYCELSGLYSVINNIKINDEEIINFAHYRRYLSSKKNHICFDSFENDLQNYKFIVPKKINLLFREPKNLIERGLLTASIEDHYIYNHIKEDWYCLINVLRDKLPQFHKEIEEFRWKKQLIPYNIFCGKFSEIKKYGEWLFSILNELDRRIEITNHPYQSRIYGFMGERLFTFYLSVYNLKHKEVTTILN